jgi:hypothetical protein
MFRSPNGVPAGPAKRQRDGKRCWISPELRDRLLEFAYSCGAKQARLDLTRFKPALQGVDGSGRGFGPIVIHGPERAWHEALDALAVLPEDLSAGLRRFLAVDSMARPDPGRISVGRPAVPRLAVANPGRADPASAERARRITQSVFRGSSQQLATRWRSTG